MTDHTGWRGVAAFLANETRRSSRVDDSPLLESQEPATSGSDVRVTFMGVSTLVVSDGTTTLLTDGFFSRPGLLKARFGAMRPDDARIGAALRRAGLVSADAVLVAHSHFDHAMDSALVATRLGARLVGSASTRNIAAADAFDDTRFVTPTPGEPMTFGRFANTVHTSVHSPGDIAPGTVDVPLSAPARYDDYKTGDCFSFHIAHPDGDLLIHPSANVVPGAFDDVRARTVYLGIGALGRQSPEFMRSYWEHVVTATGAERVVVIHWDNFFRSLERPLKPIPRPGDDFVRTVAFLTDRCDGEGIELVIPRLASTTDPFRPHRRPSAP